MICERCKETIPEGEEMNHMGKTLCEDCYVEAIEPPRTCDVAAVHSAKIARKMAGHVGTDGLTNLQKDIYDYVKANGRAKPEELMKKFQLPKWQWDKNMAVLRHCELLKAQKDGADIYITIMDGQGPGAIDLG